jgi:hypothetical protein
LSNLSLSDGFLSNAHLERGMAYQKQNMLYEALFEYDTALQLTPDDKYVHWHRATTLLSLGEYEEGFKEHDWAWKLFDWQGFGPVRGDMARIRHLSMWHGEDISGERLLVYHELGFGDAIQCMRYLPELRRRAAHVTLVINSELVRLAQQFGVDVIDHVPEDVSDFTYRLPMFGVMSALKQTLHNIPSQPYIHSKYRYQKTGHLMGVCWSGRTQTAFTQDFFMSKLAHEGFEVHSLQLGPTTDGVYPLGSKDFADTVELIEAMDHVVTIDSAPAHLAGAMGHGSVHLLLPFFSDWRWWYATTWYPRIKTYKQTSVGDWSLPFTKLNEALRAN